MKVFFVHFSQSYYLISLRSKCLLQHSCSCITVFSALQVKRKFLLDSKAVTVLNYALDYEGIRNNGGTMRDVLNLLTR
jgi:hypothetical protein